MLELYLRSRCILHCHNDILYSTSSKWNSLKDDISKITMLSEMTKVIRYRQKRKQQEYVATISINIMTKRWFNILSRQNITPVRDDYISLHYKIKKNIIFQICCIITGSRSSAFWPYVCIISQNQLTITLIVIFSLYVIYFIIFFYKLLIFTQHLCKT